jgi:DNA-binding NarL/FixJ family response regulator
MRTIVHTDFDRANPTESQVAFLDHAPPEQGMPRILIFDEHGVYRLGLALTLRSAIPGSEVFEADSIETALSMLQADPAIDVALLDIEVYPLEAPALLDEITRLAPQTRLVLLIPWNSPDAVLAAISAGFHGAVSKAQSDQEIIDATSDVLSGRIYVPPWIVGAREERAGEQLAGVSSRDGSQVDDRVSRLTPRQKEVFLLIAEGLSNREIAQKLEISEATAKIHIAAVFRTLQVRNRTEAALLAGKWRT